MVPAFCAPTIKKSSRPLLSEPIPQLGAETTTSAPIICAGVVSAVVPVLGAGEGSSWTSPGSGSSRARFPNTLGALGGDGDGDDMCHYRLGDDIGHDPYRESQEVFNHSY